MTGWAKPGWCRPTPTRTAEETRGASSEGVDHMAATTERGYGWEHQQARAKALQDLARHPGQPCPFCGNPMFVDMPLDYDHYPPLALGGGGIRRLSDASCNRRAGQALAQQRRRRTRTRVVNSRRW